MKMAMEQKLEQNLKRIGIESTKLELKEITNENGDGTKKFIYLIYDIAVLTEKADVKSASKLLNDGYFFRLDDEQKKDLREGYIRCKYENREIIYKINKEEPVLLIP